MPARAARRRAREQAAADEAEKEIAALEASGRKFRSDKKRQKALKAARKRARERALSRAPSRLLREKLGAQVVPVVWEYHHMAQLSAEEPLWRSLHDAFPAVWGASAFKGAAEPHSIWPPLQVPK